MKKNRLLLQACCAPCSAPVLEKLSDQFQLTLYYFNPNIFPETEYFRRLEEFGKLKTKFNFEFLAGDYQPQAWQDYISGLENEPEGGARCVRCFEYRLKQTAQLAKTKNYELFGTTLTLSPHKNSDLINQLGLQQAKKQEVNYLTSNFKKENGFLRSVELSRELGLQRQSYCGCLFSR